MIDELKKIEADFTGFVKTLELKFFKGKLHQRIVAQNPGQVPDHAWVPIDSHDVEAPKPGEPIGAVAHDRRESDQSVAEKKAEPSAT